MIELNEEYEQDWLESSLNEPWKITALPVSVYHKFFDFLVQEGRWQDVFKITQVKDKIVYQTLDEVLSGAQVIYSTTWTPEEAMRQYDQLLDNAHMMSDQELANRVELLYQCVPVDYMISSTKLDLIIKRRIIDYCERNDQGVSQYDGPIPYIFYKNLFFKL